MEEESLITLPMFPHAAPTSDVVILHLREENFPLFADASVLEMIKSIRGKMISRVEMQHHRLGLREPMSWIHDELS